MVHREIPTHWATPILNRGLWLFVVGVLIVLWALVLSFTHAYRSRLIEASTLELVQHNSVVAQHTSALLSAVETDLRVVDRWLLNHPGSDPLNDPQFVALINDMRALSGGLIDIRMVTASGKLHYIPDPERRARVDVSDRDYYRAHLPTGRGTEGGPQVLHYGDAVPSRVTGKWGIPVSWRLTKEVGGFRVVFAAIELDRLTAPHERWRMKDEGSILLIREDGRLLSHAPFDAQHIGMDVSGLPEYRMAQGKRQGSFVFDGRTSDHVKRIVSFERLEGRPLAAVATRGFDEALAPYYTLRDILLWTAAGLTLLVLAFAIAIHRTQQSLIAAQGSLQRQALTDDLTEVMNRRAFVMQVEREFARAKRRKEDLALMMIDVDHFKMVNDGHGHAVGDEVLVVLSRVWSQALRGNDLLGRLGGEEFGVVLPNTDRADALDIAQRLCALSSQAKVSAQASELSVCVSIGLAWRQEADEDWQPILARADLALYRAKENGRNRVEAQVV